MNDCKHIQFEFSHGDVLFRGKQYMLAAASVVDFSYLDYSNISSSLLSRRYTYYTYENYQISFKKSDYGRSKLYDGGNNKLTLYVTICPKENFINNDKIIFLVEKKHITLLQYGIHCFNSSICTSCFDRDICPNKLNVDNFQPMNNSSLSSDLFDI